MNGLENFTGVVKFSATWCGPCKVVAPIVQKVARDKGVALLELDIEENPEAVKEFQVRGVPAVFYLKDGKVVDSTIGSSNEETYATMIDKIL